MAARTGIARDLHVEDLGLRRREVGDGPPPHLERFPEAGTAVGASLEGESERRGVTDAGIKGLILSDGESPFSLLAH
ncbi:MAG: hypothetical protein ACREEC_05495, partial [Thermoplasmata archaeon]